MLQTAPMKKELRMIQLIAQGNHSCSRLGKRLGVSHQKVRAMLDKNGVDTDSSSKQLRVAEAKIRRAIDLSKKNSYSKKGRTVRKGEVNMADLDKEAITNEMVRLYKDENLTMEEIGEKFGVTKQRVQQRFKEAGVSYETKAKERFKREDLVEYHINQQLGTKEIAEIYGCNHTTIIKYLELYDIRRRYPQKNINLTKEVLKRLYVDEGLSQSEIGRRYGYVQSAVANLLARHGIPRRKTWAKKGLKVTM